MSTSRKISDVRRAQSTTEGAGVLLKRVFGYHQTPQFDPFLLLDEFGSENPDDYMAGFPWHPHRGIETVTYMLEGAVEHGDSIGNSGVIRSGDIQWMTAGSGIIHQEMPKRYDGKLRGFQLWVNLPPSHKMMEPRYREVTNSQVPEITPQQGVVVKIISGEIEGVKGPVQDIIVPVEYYDITLESGKEFTLDVQESYNVFAYVIDGSGSIGINNENRIESEYLAHLIDGERVFLKAEDIPFRLLLVAGAPIREPIAWYGPIVMNWHEELELAFQEYRAGTFIKTKSGFSKDNNSTDGQHFYHS